MLNKNIIEIALIFLRRESIKDTNNMHHASDYYILQTNTFHIYIYIRNTIQQSYHKDYYNNTQKHQFKACDMHLNTTHFTRYLFMCSVVVSYV